MTKAPLYRSETRSVPIPSLPPPLRNALLTHADTKKLKMAGAQAWLTHRENPVAPTLRGRVFGTRSNRADPGASHDMVLVLHETHLLVGTTSATGGTTVRSLPLVLATAEATPRDGRDAGLTIGGFPPEALDAQTCFMGLGTGPDADACVLAVLGAVDAAKIPAA